MGVSDDLKKSLENYERDAMITGAASIAGAIAGAVLWKQHRVLGLFSGGTAAAVASSLALSKGKDWPDAVQRLGTTAGSVGGSLMWPRHPILGFLAGGLVTGAATCFVPGTSSMKAIEAMRKDEKKLTSGKVK